MDRCPACNAKVRENSMCRRCKTDLSLLIAVEDDAAHHTEQARQAFQSTDFSRMFFHAKRACSLRATPASRALLTAATLLTGRFDAALVLWKSREKTIRP